MNATMRVLLERRSCRSFDLEKHATDDEIASVLKAAVYAPSAKNDQAWHFTVVQNAQKLEELNTAVYQKMDGEARERIAGRAEDKGFQFCYRAPALIIVSARESAHYPREDCAAAIENMLIAATSLGLGSCWINQLTEISFDTDIRAFLDTLGVPHDYKVFGAVALGYATKVSPMKDRAPGTVNFVK